MEKQTIQAYIIDQVKTPPSQLLQQTKKCNSHPAFASVLATKINPNKQGWIQILSTECITKNIGNIADFQQKLINSYHLLMGIGLMNDHGWYIGQQEIKQLLAFNASSQRIKILAYRFQLLVQQTAENQKNAQQDKKQQKQTLPKTIETALKHGIHKCFPQQCKITNNSQIDLWKWAYFICTQLLFPNKNIIKDIFQRILQKQKLNKQQQTDLLPPKLPSLKQLQHLDIEAVDKFMNCLRNCLNPFPELCPSFKQIAYCLQCVIGQIDKRGHDGQYLKKYYKDKMLKKIGKMQEDMGDIVLDEQTLILTLDIKKKMSTNIQKIVGRTVKQFRPLYRAKKYQFSPQIFYAKCSGKGSLLICIETIDNGKIFAYISPQIDLLEQNGIQGKFISDQLLYSFIYSTKTQQTHKLSTKNKAYKSVPLSGPIIGDGDLIIGNNPDSNYSYFPKSYQSTKKKKLIQKQQQGNNGRFKINNYDVYQVIFKK